MNPNIQNLLHEQLAVWEMARTNYIALTHAETKELQVNGIPYRVQYNPARTRSSTAAVDERSIRERTCFLCAEHLPAVQRRIPVEGHYNLLVNPYPIFPQHLTIAEAEHTEQRILPRFGEMLSLARQLPDFTLFYNGPRCGASAPDHAHFQAGSRNFLPIEHYWRERRKGGPVTHGKAYLWSLDDAPRTTLIIESSRKEDAVALFRLIHEICETQPNEHEPMFNILSWYENKTWVVCIFFRERHRPSCYTAGGDSKLIVSPASVDMGGVFITPFEEDFRKITAGDIERILSEVCLPAKKFEQLQNNIRAQADGMQEIDMPLRTQTGR